MKIDDYIRNPVGKGAIIPGKEQILMALDYRLQVIQKYNEIVMKIYKNGEDVFYHVLIPSENKDREMNYDVIIKFKKTDKSDKFDQSYRQHEIEFFSNCPSFTYGYAYVAHINGNLVKEFIDKYDPKVLKYPPVSKNPGLVFGYEKSIYFACKCILADKRVLLKSYVDSYAMPLTPEIIKSIRHMNRIEEEYARATKVMNEENRKHRVKVSKKAQETKDKIVYGEEHVGSSKPNVKVIKKTKASKNEVNKITKIKPTKKKK